MNEQNIPQEKIVDIEKEREYKIPFQESLENVVSVLESTAYETPQKRLEALRPIGSLCANCYNAITKTINRITENAKLGGWNGDSENAPAEILIHDLRNTLSFLSNLSVFERYGFLEEEQEIGDTEPEKLIKKYLKDNNLTYKDLSKKDIESAQKNWSKHPIAEFLKSSPKSEYMARYENWEKRRIFTPDNQIELSQLCRNALENFTYRTLGPKYVSEEFVEAEERNFLLERRGKDNSMLKSMGPEAYQNAMKILDEEFYKLKEEK